MIIPWPIVTIIDWMASPFGFDTYARATGGSGWHWGRVGAERVYFIRRPVGQPRYKALRPRKETDDNNQFRRY